MGKHTKGESMNYFSLLANTGGNQYEAWSNHDVSGHMTCTYCCDVRAMASGIPDADSGSHFRQATTSG